MSEYEAIKDIDEREFALADALTESLLKSLNDDSNIVTKMDILNASLMFLNFFFCIHIDDIDVETVKERLTKMISDGDYFKEFLVESMMFSKYHNKVLLAKKMSEGDDNGF